MAHFAFGTWLRVFLAFALALQLNLIFPATQGWASEAEGTAPALSEPAEASPSPSNTAAESTPPPE